MEKEKRNMKDDEAALFLGLSPQTLRNYRSQGNKGPAYIKIGRAVRYTVKDLEAFIEQHRVTSCE